MSWTAAKSVMDSLGQNQWKTLLNTQTIKTSTEPEHYTHYQIQRRRFTGRFCWFFKHTHTHTHTISMSSELSRAEPGHSSGHLTGEIKESICWVFAISLLRERALFSHTSTLEFQKRWIFPQIIYRKEKPHRRPQWGLRCFSKTAVRLNGKQMELPASQISTDSSRVSEEILICISFDFRRNIWDNADTEKRT